LLEILQILPSQDLEHTTTLTNIHGSSPSSQDSARLPESAHRYYFKISSLHQQVIL